MRGDRDRDAAASSSGSSAPSSSSGSTPSPSSARPPPAEDNEYLAMFRERMATLHELTAPSHAARRNQPEEEEEEEEREEEDDAPAASAHASATTTLTTRAAEADSESPPDAFDRRATPRLTPLAAMYVQTHVAPLRRIYSWAVPTSEALDAVADAARLAAAMADGSEEDARRRELPLGAAAVSATAAAEEAPPRVVEIGAGTGYWTSLLRRRGVRVAAYDLAPCDGAEPNGHHRLDATAAANTNRVDANASGGADEKRSRVFETTTTFTFTPPGETAARPNPLHPPPFARVRRGGAASVAAHGVSAALFLCWPPSESEREGFASVSETGARPRPGGSDDAAANDDLSASAPRAAVATMALDALRAYRGNVVAYAGELPSERASDGARRGGDRTRHPPGGGGGGEKGEKGATAGDAFHDALRESFALERRVVLPRWPGANDSLTVWRRKKPRRRHPPEDDAANKRRAREERRGRGSEGLFHGSEYSAREMIPLVDRDGAFFGDDDDVFDASSFSGAAFRDARDSLVRSSAAAWEDAVVARVAARRARGAGGARPGFERRAVDAARSRASTLLRRLALFAL